MYNDNGSSPIFRLYTIGRFFLFQNSRVKPTELTSKVSKLTSKAAEFTSKMLKLTSKLQIHE